MVSEQLLQSRSIPSEEGLEQEFNSLQAQREACEAFITSQRHEGWVCLCKAYDDGGFSGATMATARRKLLARSVIAQIVRGRDPSAIRPHQSTFPRPWICASNIAIFR